jgi:flagellin-like protein
MKSITPVVSVILLIMLTIVASAGAYFFITSSVNDLENSGAIEGSPYLDNSRLNLVSITGSQALVRNDGSSPVTEMVVLINGETLNYTLDTPIMPGEIREINYTNQIAGQDLEIKVIYNKGKTEKDKSPAIVNTQSSGFSQSSPCGDSICDLNNGENIANCPEDCSPKSVAFHMMGQNIIAVYKINTSEGYIYGNQSIIYTSSAEIESKIDLTLNNKAIMIFSEEEDYIHDFFYLSYDGNSWNNAVTASVFNQDNSQSRLYSSSPTKNLNLHFAYFNCSDDCIFTYLKYNFVNGFFSPKVITENIVEYGSADNGIDFSYDETHGFAFWSNTDSNLVNISRYSGNEWQSPETVINGNYDGGYYAINWVRGGINNLGEILITYCNMSKTYYAFINNTINIGELFDSPDCDIAVSGIKVFRDNSFYISIESEEEYFYTIFRDNSFSGIEPLTSIIMGSASRMFTNELNLMAISSEGAIFRLINLDGSLSPLADVRLCEMHMLNPELPQQKYARCPEIYLTEEQCSDGVDNDGDGYYDLNDSDCQ